MKKMIALCLLFSAPVFAGEALSIGEISNNLLEPITILSDFINNACLIIGICLLFSSFLRYMQYRVNPMAAPISSVIVLLITGIVLVCLPFIYKLTESGIPFHLL